MLALLCLLAFGLFCLFLFLLSLFVFCSLMFVIVLSLFDVCLLFCCRCSLMFGCLLHRPGGDPVRSARGMERDSRQDPQGCGINTNLSIVNRVKQL